MSLLIVGSMALDTIETPYGMRERALGGSAVYAGLAASFFTNVQIVGVIGEDFPENALQMLKKKGVDISGVQREKGKTFFWHGRYHQNMNERDTLTTELNVFENFNPVLPERFKSTPYLFLANIQPALQLSVLEQMKKPKIVACDTMNLWIETTYEELLEVIARIQILLINDSEARMLAKENNLFRAIKKIHALGPEVCIVKKGEHGAVLSTQKLLFFIPAYPLLSFRDPTGAGDTFAGGFMGYLAGATELNEQNLKKAILYGTVLASFNVEHFSTEGLENLSIEEINQRLKTLTDMMRF